MLPSLNTTEGLSAWWSICGKPAAASGRKTSGLYATSGSGVCKAGKRKGLLWKEVDDGTTDVATHFSNVKCFLSCVLWTAVLAFLLTKGIMELQSIF